MASGGEGSLGETIKQFATKANNKECTSKDMTKWCKDAGIFGKTCTSNNMDIAFAKCVRSKPSKCMGVTEIDALCDELAGPYMKDKKIDKKEAAAAEIKRKLAGASKDLSKGTTKQSKTGGVDKMTDASKYTGAHKERFDKDGKGKGIEGREDRADNKGYVGAYKGEGTYDKKTGGK